MKIAPFPGPMQQVTVRSGRHHAATTRKWSLTQDQEAWLREYFPKTENTLLMKHTGMSHGTLHRFAQSLGLAKSEEGLHAIRHRQMLAAKQTCESNGYYDSIRGQPPSEATRQGTARMWQEIRDGKREPPMAAMKRESPWRYASLMKRKSEQRKATLAAERRRQLFGLPTKTGLARLAPLSPYTRSQVAHRYNAIRRGYVLASECHEGSGHRYVIYFDSDTRRSPQFERNCEKDGFMIRKWDGELTALNANNDINHDIRATEESRKSHTSAASGIAESH